MRNNIKFFAILLVILCCFMGAASAVDDVSIDIVDSSVDDAVSVDAIPEDTYGSLSEINSVTNNSDIELNDGKDNIGNTKTVTATASDWDGLYNNVINGESEILLTGTEYLIDSNKNIEFNNDVIITGNSNSYVTGGSLSYTPFICSDPSLSITLRNIKFTNITSQILIQLAGTTTIENCSFENIQTATGGRYSVIYNNYGFMKIAECNFTNCNAPYGAVTNYHSIPTNVRMNVSNCKFENNTASSDPGAINNCGYLNVTNSTFIFNHANLWAGGIHTHINAYTRIFDSNFTGNTAGWNGGALFSYGKLEVYNSIFDNNNCTTNNGGGAIGGFPYGGSKYNITIENCNFTNNNNLCGEFTNESTTSLGRGGAISALNGGTLNVHGSRFVHNAAVIGQAICGYNTVYDNATGGEPYLQIYNNTFINHTVTTNDTVYISNGNYTFENNTFINSPQTQYNQNNNYDATESNSFDDLNSKNTLGKSILSDGETPTNVWYVDPAATGANDGSSWEDAYTNLNNALSNVENDGIIYVADGVYTRKAFNRPMNITLIAQGENAIFNSFESKAYGNTLNLDAEYTFINFTFKQADVGRNTVFINCTFYDSLQLTVMKYRYTMVEVYELIGEDQWKQYGYAFTFNATFDNCVFKNLDSEDAPITVYKYGKAEFYNCTFENISSDSIINKIGDFVLDDGIYFYDCSFSNINVNGIADIPGDIEWGDYCAIENCDYDFAATTDIVSTDECTHNYINATLLKVTITNTSLYAYPDYPEIILSEDEIEDINIELTADDEPIDGAVDVYIGEELYDTYYIIGNDIISIPYSAFSLGVNNVTVRYNGDDEENYGPSDDSFTIVAYGEPAYIEIYAPNVVVGNNASISFSIVDEYYEEIDAIDIYVEVWSQEYDGDLDEFFDSELLYEGSVNSNELISLDLPIGMYSVIAVSDYDEGYTYYVSESIENFNVFNKFTSIFIFPADDDETTLDNFEYAIQVYDMADNPISANVTIILDGDEENPIAFETIVFDPENEDEGPAVFDFGQLSYGKHIIEVYYAGDEESGWLETYESREFIVLYPSFLKVETSDVFIGDDATVVIELTGPNGEALNGKVYIYVESNAQTLFNEDIDIDGSYEFTLENLSEDCIIYAEFFGTQFEYEEFDSDSSYYAGIRSNGFIRVSEVMANIELSISEDGSSVIATLTDGEGNAIANASVSISANGVESILTTDADGKASLPVSGNTTAVASYVDENNITVSSSLNIIVISNEIIKEVNNTIVLNNTIEVPLKRTVTEIGYE
ncbi:Ig-like domain-containing protein, partial [uncultured Methanobrevibacter sp.]|uniref:Ig-like domain-containing protein n=1 Tax=uncultured Methanobrevibacter sp. TaxID=253161 RepID=UPI00261E97E5